MTRPRLPGRFPGLLLCLLLLAGGPAPARPAPIALPSSVPAPPFDAHIRAAIGALRAHLPRLAAAEYQAALRLRPGDADAHFALGGVWEILGRSADAEREYRRTIQIDPTHAPAHSALAGLLDDRGLVAAALAQGAQALVLLPGDARLHCNQGDMLTEARRWNEARHEYLTALRLSPGLQEARHGLTALSRLAPKPGKPSAHRRGTGPSAGFARGL